MTGPSSVAAERSRWPARLLLAIQRPRSHRGDEGGPDRKGAGADLGRARLLRLVRLACLAFLWRFDADYEQKSGLRDATAKPVLDQPDYRGRSYFLVGDDGFEPPTLSV